MKNITDKTPRTAKDILAEARKFGRGKIAQGYHDEVYGVDIEDIQILLDAGADPVYLNKPNEDKKEHLVKYAEHNFNLNTDNQIDWNYSPSLEEEITGGEW